MLTEPKSIQSLAGFGNPAVNVAINYGQNRYGNQLVLDQHTITVENGRLAAQADSLSVRGFNLVEHRTAVTDFRDQSQLDSIYQRELAELLARLTGCRKVINFHNQLRDNNPEACMEVRKPVQFVHIDHDEATYSLRAREVLGSEADYWLQYRFACYNIWRGLDPVEELPLAVCDARTVREEDMRRVEVHERPGMPTPYAGMTLTFNPEQRWYYFPRMQPHEAIVFKQCDTNHSGIRWCPHVAVEDATIPNPRRRVSYEARVIVFFDQLRDAH